jgi:hypothetical protein
MFEIINRRMQNKRHLIGNPVRTLLTNSEGGDFMVYLVDPAVITKRRCQPFCGFIIKPMYGVIVWPPP